MMMLLLLGFNKFIKMILEGATKSQFLCEIFNKISYNRNISIWGVFFWVARSVQTEPNIPFFEDPNRILYIYITYTYI